jgi:hypothetical protein
MEVIGIETKLGVADAIDLCIDKVGVKKVLKIIRVLCHKNTIEKCSFPSNLLATKKDEEMANAACALLYLENNWKHAADKGFEMLAKKKND